jgi:solute carrier family 6 (neurotransmitter transporter, GABA) member 1
VILFRFIMAFFRKAVDFIAPQANKHDDGRDAWPSRTAFVLAAMGGAIGLGNVLRYPSQVYNNNGVGSEDGPQYSLTHTY